MRLASDYPPLSGRLHNRNADTFQNILINEYNLLYNETGRKNPHDYLISWQKIFDKIQHSFMLVFEETLEIQEI